MIDEPDPPRKFYKLKGAEFERVNAPAGSAEASAPNDVQSIFRAAAAEKKLEPAPVSEPKTNEVHSVLHDNLARANAAGLNDVSLRPKRPSRRKLDFWTLFVFGNFFFGVALAYFGLRTVPGISAAAGMIFFSVSLTWVMWFIMDDY